MTSDSGFPCLTDQVMERLHIARPSVDSKGLEHLARAPLAIVFLEGDIRQAGGAPMLGKICGKITSYTDRS